MQDYDPGGHNQETKKTFEKKTAICNRNRLPLAGRLDWNFNNQATTQHNDKEDGNICSTHLQTAHLQSTNH
jgi:hypothetical protein